MFTREKLRLLVAEYLGTAMLAGVVLITSNMFGLGTAAWYTALTAGLALMVIIGTIGNVSGAHVNPAVTLGLWTLRKIDTLEALIYIGAQMLGGASALLFYNYATGVNLVNRGSAAFAWNSFWVEAVGAAVFGMGIVAVMVQKLEGQWSAFVTGLSLSFGALIASLASAGFLNPAVALGNNAWNRTLAVAPIVGMVVGMNVYMALLAPLNKPATKSTKKKK